MRENLKPRDTKWQFHHIYKGIVAIEFEYLLETLKMINNIITISVIHINIKSFY